MRRVFAGEAVVYEFKSITLKGRVCWMETHAVPLRDARGADRDRGEAGSTHHRAAAASSASRASTQRAPCGVRSFFQNGAWVFR